MGKHSITFGLAALLVLNLSGLAFAQDASEKPASTRRLAMALPKPGVQPVLPVRASVPAVGAKSQSVPLKTVLSPLEEFASHPLISRTVNRRQIPDNLRQVLIECASRAEQASRSQNRRIAEVIVWLVNSMNQSTTISPIGSPGLRWQRLIEPQSSTPSDQNNIFQID
jgi:hypothetical protein